MSETTNEEDLELPENHDLENDEVRISKSEFCRFYRLAEDSGRIYTEIESLNEKNKALKKEIRELQKTKKPELDKIDTLQDEVNTLKNENNTLQSEIEKCKELIARIDVENRYLKIDSTTTRIVKTSDRIEQKSIDNLLSDYHIIVEQKILAFQRSKLPNKRLRAKLRSLVADILFSGTVQDHETALNNFKSQCKREDLYSYLDDYELDFEEIYESSSSLISELKNIHENAEVYELCMPTQGETFNPERHEVLQGCKDVAGEVIQFAIYPVLQSRNKFTNKVGILHKALVFTQLES
jgi:DNA repair exonuclease SbcCD ATPase subunit